MATTRTVPRAALQFLSPLEGGAAPPATPTDTTRRLSGVAYSGGVIKHPYWDQVVFDLASVSIPTPIPLLLEHDRTARAGVVESASVVGDIRIHSRIFSETEAGRQAVALADAGFPWQLSVYIVPGLVEEVQAGATATVNGISLTGPASIFRSAVIREISLCSVAADPNTSAVAASQGDTLSLSVTTQRTTAMPPDAPNQAQPPVAAPDDLAARFAELTASSAALRTQLDALVAENTAIKRGVRQGEIDALFASLGRKPEEKEKEMFHALDGETFSFVAGQIKASKAALPDHLFTEQATGGGGETQHDKAHTDLLVSL